VVASRGSHLAIGGNAGCGLQEVCKNPDGILARVVWLGAYSRQSVGAALMYLSEHPRTLGPGRTWVLLSERAACECEQVAQGRKHDESTAVCHRDARGLTNLRGAIGVYFQRDQLAAEIQEHASSS
jgi:hypothetical protein